MVKPAIRPRGAILTLIAAVLSSTASPSFANDTAHPTVVELFQSQGCSSCPPAIANINAIAGRRDVLALMFAVTYWDSLGWKDTFAKPEFTERQRDFARAGGRGGVATPQTIINGRIVTNGGNRAQLISAIRSADRGTSGPSVEVNAGRIRIGSGQARHGGIVWLVRYDPRPVNVPIRAGENGGRTITHRNIVRTLTAIGRWKGAPLTIAAPPSRDPNLRSAILVQDGTGGAIVAASQL